MESELKNMFPLNGLSGYLNYCLYHMAHSQGIFKASEELELNKKYICVGSALEIQPYPYAKKSFPPGQMKDYLELNGNSAFSVKKVYNEKTLIGENLILDIIVNRKKYTVCLPLSNYYFFKEVG